MGVFYALVFLTFALGDKGVRDVSNDGQTLKFKLFTYCFGDHVYYSSHPYPNLQRIYENLVQAQSSSALATDSVPESMTKRELLGTNNNTFLLRYIGKRTAKPS